MRAALRPDPLPWLGHTKNSAGSRLCFSYWAEAASYSLIVSEDTSQDGKKGLRVPSVAPSRPTCKLSGAFIPLFGFRMHHVSRATEAPGIWKCAQPCSHPQILYRKHLGKQDRQHTRSSQQPVWRGMGK